MHTIRVFVDEDGNFGNPVGVVVDEGKHINQDERQKIAVKLGFSEAVFINSISPGDISIFNPQEEITFAGTAVIVSVWLLQQMTHTSIDELHCKDGSIKTWTENGSIWIRAGMDIMPPWNYVQRNSPSEIEAFTPEEASRLQHTFLWAWMDESKGMIRARTYAPDWGIPEDEANGSGAMKLAATLGINLEVLHGKGSIIYAKPSTSGFVDLGGRLKEDFQGYTPGV
jgi:predicted PhzF superfamily epimerase YddE/YHI9